MDNPGHVNFHHHQRSLLTYPIPEILPHACYDFINPDADRWSQPEEPTCKNSMLRRSLSVVFISALFWVVSWITPPTALALIPLQISELSYQSCPPSLSEGLVDSGTLMAANCFLVTGKVENRSGKPAHNADVYGRIYDANNNPVQRNRNRLGSIDEVPPGVSDFAVRISVPSNQPMPLSLKQFKASGFTGHVRR